MFSHVSFARLLLFIFIAIQSIPSAQSHGRNHDNLIEENDSPPLPRRAYEGNRNLSDVERNIRDQFRREYFPRLLELNNYQRHHNAGWRIDPNQILFALMDIIVVKMLLEELYNYLF